MEKGVFSDSSPTPSISAEFLVCSGHAPRPWYDSSKYDSGPRLPTT